MTKQIGCFPACGEAAIMAGEPHRGAGETGV